MKHPTPAHNDWIAKKTFVNSGPSMLTILTSDKCNLECFMCKPPLSKVDIKFNFEQIAPFLQTAHSVYLTGGEPLLKIGNATSETGDLIQCIINHFPHLKINAYTNGTFLNKKMSTLVLKHFEGLNISIDTIDPKLYERIRGKPLLHRVLKNIKTLKELKKKAGLGPHDEPYIKMNTIVMKSTIEGLPTVAKKLVELGGHRHFLLKLRSDKRSYNRKLLNSELLIYHPVSKKILEKLKRELTQIYSSSGLEVEDQACVLSNCQPEKPKPSSYEAVCPEPWVNADIRLDGGLYCCCSNSTILGNIKHHSFEEIWNGKTAIELRKSFINREMKGCSRNGCPALVDYFSVNRDSYSKDLFSSLENRFDEREKIKSIILLRSAQSHITHRVSLTLLKYFPKLRLTIISNPQGANECLSWKISAKILTYPHNFFEPKRFKHWWSQYHNDASYCIASSVYNNDDRKGYKNIEDIVKELNAKHKIGIKQSGELVSFPP